MKIIKYSIALLLLLGLLFLAIYETNIVPIEGI